MKYLLIPLLLSLSMPSFASYVRCYSQGKVIYSGYATEVAYDERFVVVKDNKTHKDVFILADCVIKL